MPPYTSVSSSHSWPTGSSCVAAAGDLSSTKAAIDVVDALLD